MPAGRLEKICFGSIKNSFVPTGSWSNLSMLARMIQNGVVSSYTQLLAERYEGKLDEDADDFIGYAVDGANRMQRLIQDLLTYSRVTTRGKPPELFEAREALEDALANLQGVIEDTGAKISIGELPRVLADRAQLVQLFQNLVGNALKFHKPGEPPVVDLHANSGKAVPRKFGRAANRLVNGGLFRSPTAESASIPSTSGACLRSFSGSTVATNTPVPVLVWRRQRIVERHGGTIRVESEPGKGATSPSPWYLNGGSIMTQYSLGEPIEILLVEDSNADARLAQEALMTSKIRNVLHRVADGEEAMAFLRREGRYADALGRASSCLISTFPRRTGVKSWQRSRGMKTSNVSLSSF